MARRAWTWTDKQLDKLNKVLAVLEEFKDYKPHTLNIFLLIIDGDINEEDPLGYQQPMRFCEVSFFKKVMPEAM